MRFNSVLIRPRHWACLLCTVGTLFGAMSVSAKSATKPSEAQSIYLKERAACLSGASHQDRATCLKEAGAAYQEAKSGRLGNGASEFERNRLQRCDAHAPQDRADCVRKANGEGMSSGSVNSGGILRELVSPGVAPAPK